MEQSSCAEVNSFSVKEFLSFHESRKFTTNLITSLILSLNKPNKSISHRSIPFLNIPFDTNCVPTLRPSKWSPHPGEPNKKYPHCSSPNLSISFYQMYAT